MTQTYDFDEMNRTVIREFRATGGRAGGVFEGMPLLLLHHIGARSGIERIAPLVPLLEDGRIFVFASKGGSDENPHWYGNLIAHPQITVELGTETFPATARVVTGGERDDVYLRQSALQPQFAEHQCHTQRLIPVVELVRSETARASIGARSTGHGPMSEARVGRHRAHGNTDPRQRRPRDDDGP